MSTRSPATTQLQGTTAATHRVDIQSLRALAVLLVIVYHLFPYRLTGGYIGVDVFFVISGYLMTDHISRAVGNRSFSLARFYVRRLRRLLPAALLVIAATVGAIFLFIPRVYWIPFLQQAIASTLYVENWKLAADSVDYLAISSTASPFQHYWSLAVEEQFYVLWPGLIIGAAVLSRRFRATARVGLIVSTAAVFIASYLYSGLATGANPTFSYFNTFTRLWEFAVGAAAMLLARAVGDRGNAHARSGVWLVGVGVVVVSAWLFSDDTTFPSWIALLPVAATGAALACRVTPRQRRLDVITGLRAVRLIGDISYSAYLVHWPLIIVFPFAAARPLRPVDRFGILVLSLLLGLVIKTFIEDRFRESTEPTGSDAGRSRKTGSTPRVLIAIALASLAIVSASAGGWYSTVADRTDAKAQLQAAIKDAGPCFGYGSLTQADCLESGIVPDPTFARDDNFSGKCLQGGGESAVKTCSLGADTDNPVQRVAVVGDSHAAQWLAALAAISADHDWQLTTYLKSSCPFSTVRLAGDAAARRDCVDWNAAVSKELATTAPDLILVSAATGVPYDTEAGESSVDAAARGMAQAWQPLLEAGSRVASIRDDPFPGRAGLSDPPSCVQSSGAGRCTFDRKAGLLEDPQTIATQREPGSFLLDMTPALCPSDTCDVVIGGVLVYRDESHLTDAYVRTTSPLMAEQLRTIDPDGFAD